MPPKTEKQRRFMEMCKHNPSHARGKCPSVKDAKRVLGEHSGSSKKKGKK